MQLIFNDIASSEVVLILVFVLIFFGSKSIPGLAKTLGKTMRQIKEASSEVQAEIKKSGVDIKKDMNLSNLINDTVDEIKRPLDQQLNEMDHAIKYSPKRKTVQPEAADNMSIEESTGEKTLVNPDNDKKEDSNDSADVKSS